MKQILTIIGILLTTILSAQNCTVCPNSNVQLTSSYPPTATHSWSCSNGFTSSLQNPVMPVGTTNVNCTLLVTQGGCVSTSTTNVTVLAGGPTATLTANRCQILLSGTTCGTVTLQRSLDGTTGWTDYITNPTFPYSVTQSYWWRIKMVCPCGTFYSNAVYIYYTTGVINSDCLIILPGWNSYTCNTWDIYKSCDNGATWTLWQSNNTSGFTFADADCCFRWVCAASTGLNNYCANDVCIVGENCNIGCNAAIGVGQAGCTMNITWVSCAGTWAIQKLIGSTWTNVASGTSPGPSSYTITSNGQYRAIQTCNSPLCNYQSVTLNFTTCGGPCTPLPSVTISQSPTPCTSTASLTANVSNCNGTATYSWNNGANTQTISGVSTGTYTVTVSGCCASTSTSYTLTCTPPNPCTGFSANITGTFTGLCVGSSYTYNRTITGGTAPFTQQWKVNGVNVGTGTSYTYTPTSAGTYTLTVTVTDANNCSYTDTKTLTVINCCGMTLSISPTTLSVCTNQNATFTVTPTGGTAPYTYNWTYNLQPSGPIIGAGTGNPTTLNIATAGTYNVVATVTDAQGCQVSIFAVLTVTNCTNCTCTPNLSLTGCVLNGGFTGAGCGNFNYQLQYSATGSGWTSVLSGSASPGGTITHTPTQNGVYRLVIVGNGGSGCTGSETPLVSVNCVPSCNCTAGVLTFASCQLSWTNPCAGAGYTADLEYFNGTSWVYVTNTTPYYPTQSGQYRVAYKKAGCTTVYSNTTNITSCCGCSPTLSFDLPCAFTWTTCSGYTGTLQKLISGVWTNISATNPYSLPQNAGSGSYRVRYTNVNCSEVISNVIVLPCDATIQSFSFNCTTGEFLADINAAFGNVYYEFYRCSDSNALACDDGGFYGSCPNSVLMASGFISPDFNLSLFPSICLNQAYTLKVWNCYDNTCTDYDCIFGSTCFLSPIVKTGCTLTWNNTQFGYTVFLQRLVAGVWTDVNSTGTYNMTNPSTFSYRLRATTSLVSNCSDSFSIPQTFSCP